LLLFLRGDAMANSKEIVRTATAWLTAVELQIVLLG
jgi:hypothetical protein